MLENTKGAIKMDYPDKLVI